MPRRLPWITSVLAITVASLPLLLFTLTTGIHGDVWWDIATGQWIWHHHAVPLRDPWSWTRRGHIWFAQEWSLNVLLSLATRLGMIGIVLWSIIPGVLLMGILWTWQQWRNPAHPFWNTLWLAITGWILAGFYGHRPQDWAYPLLAWWLYVLDRYRGDGRRTWAVWSLPLIMLIWVNAHGSFFLGVGFLALAVGWAWIRPQQWADTRARYYLSGLLGGAVGVTALNPHGWTLWPAMLMLSQGAGTAGTLNGEWASPNFHQPAVALAYLLILALSAVAVWVSQRRVTGMDAFCWIGFYFAALHNTRFLADDALWFPIWMATYGSSGAAQIAWSRRWRRMGPFALTLWAGVLGVHIGLVAPTALTGPLTHHARLEPTRAVAWMKAHHATQHVFNAFPWGGYLIAEGIAPWMDGRGLLYGSAPHPSIARQYRTVVFLSSQNPWPILRRWHPQIFLLPPTVPLTGFLAHQPHWRVVYHSSDAEVILPPPSWDAGPSVLSKRG